MKSPVEVTIGRKNEGAQNVRHIYYMVHAKDKYLALKRIVDYYPNIYGIIFLPYQKRDTGDSRKTSSGRLRCRLIAWRPFPGTTR